MKKYILVIDQGTTSSRVILVNKKAEIVYKDYIELELIKEAEGKILQDANEILKSVKILIERVFRNYKTNPEKIGLIAISNQRETTFVWNKYTKEVVGSAISWQSNHTKEITDEWIKKGLNNKVFNKTGLLINPYFSASKLVDIIKKYEGNIDDLLFGTIDSFLIYNLTTQNNHYTDITNASRTMLFNIKEAKWDLELLKAFNIKENLLPKVLANDSFYGNVLINGLDADGMRIVRDVLLELKSQGVTILISSHILGELEKIATHYGVIKNGRLIKELSAEEMNKEFKSFVFVKTNQNQDAYYILKNKYKDVSINDEGIRIYDESKSEEVARFIFENKIMLKEINYSHIGLEEYYLTIMSNKELMQNE